MSDLPRFFVDQARAYLRDSYMPRIERCLDELTDADVWWRPNEESNSIGNLLLHLDGSTRMWIVSAVGGAAITRERQQEFDERSQIPSAEMLARLKRTLTEVDDVLKAVDSSTMLDRRTVRDEEVTVLEAIFHAVEHFSMHTGQIIMLTKMRTGKDLKLD